jgi:hypothetical protein
MSDVNSSLSTVLFRAYPERMALSQAGRRTLLSETLGL